MTDQDGTQKGGTSPVSNTGKQFAARRTIVKGMASAVPVVMTIGCGQALAQASNVQACITKDGPWAGEPPLCTDALDNFYREEVDSTADCTNPFADLDETGIFSEPTKYGAKGFPDSGSTLDGSSFMTAYETTTVQSGVDGKGAQTLNSASQPDGTAQVPRYRLLFVDQDGYPTTSDPRYALSASCAISFGFDGFPP